MKFLILGNKHKMKFIKKEIKQLQKENKFKYDILRVYNPTEIKIQQQFKEIAGIDVNVKKALGGSSLKYFPITHIAYFMYITPSHHPEFFQDSTVTGFLCAFSLIRKDNDILEILVLNSHLGCGGLMIDFLEKNNDVNKIILVSSVLAVHFYQKKGFWIDTTWTYERFQPVMIKFLKGEESFENHNIQKNIPLLISLCSKWERFINT